MRSYKRKYLLKHTFPKVIMVVVILFLIFEYFQVGVNVPADRPRYDDLGNFYNTYDPTCFYGDQYINYEDDNYYSLKGIDVSVHQKEIDFTKVKEAGIEFVYIRLGYRGYSLGKLNLDANFEKNYKDAKDAGLLVGVYFFSQAISNKEVEEECEFIIEHIKNKTIDLPIAFDYEDVDDPLGRIGFISAKRKLSNVHAFFDFMKEHNKEGILYGNLSFITDNYDIGEIADYPLWYAQYYKEPQYPYLFQIWQYSDKGEVDGIEGNVDLNIMFMERKKEAD